MKNRSCISCFAGIVSRLLFVSTLAGCDRNESTPHAIYVQQNRVERPDTEIRDARILVFNKERVTTEIIARRVLTFEARDSTIAHALHVTSFDSMGQSVSLLTSDSGLIKEATGYMIAFGQVSVHTQDSTRLETEQLHWDLRKNIIATDAFVRITRKNGDYICGSGLVSDPKLKLLKIPNPVKGIAHIDSSLN